MSWILVCGAVVCAWAMLRTMGGERERRAREQLAALPPPPPPVPIKPAEPPAAAKRPPAGKPKTKWARQAA